MANENKPGKQSYSLYRERELDNLYCPELQHPFTRVNPDMCEGVTHRFPMGKRTCICGKQTVPVKEYTFNNKRKKASDGN